MNCVDMRARLRAAERLVGVFVNLPAPGLVELLASAGVDFVVIDCEHGLLNPESVEGLIRAAGASGIGAMIRVPAGEPAAIQRYVDAGASGVQVPMIETAEQAAAVVAAARYAPEGRRGVAATRSNGFAAPSAERLQTANETTAIVLQIETGEGVAAAAEIAAVPGVDSLFIGPTDLAHALGRGGQLDHPDVDQAIRTVRKAVGDLPLGILVGSGEDAAKRAGEGMSYLVGTSGGLIRAAVRGLVDSARSTSGAQS